MHLPYIDTFILINSKFVKRVSGGYNHEVYKLSERIKTLPVSSIRQLIPLSIAAKKDGVKVLHLNIGDPDIKTPKVMLDVLRNWEIETIRYSDSKGEPPTLAALENYYHRLGFKAIKEENILVTVGGSEAVVMSLFAVASPGDEVLVFEPFYSNYAALAHFSGVKLVGIPTAIKDGFHLPAKLEIEKAITKKTKAILFCSPNNPTGAIYSRKEVQVLVEVAKNHDLFLISDEVYREFIFDKTIHTSILDFLDQIPNQIILLDSLSKRYSLCGARIGLVASLNKEVIAGVTKIAKSRLSAGLIEQLMAAKLTRVPVSYTKAVIAEYKKRREVVFIGLSKIKGVFLTKPEGAFYAMVSLPVKDAEDFCRFLLTDFRLNNTTVMLAPGAGFYLTANQGLDQVRIAYVLNTKDLDKSIKIIEAGLTAYRLKAGLA